MARRSRGCRTADLRAIADDLSPGTADWEERMQWGMPGYGPSGRDNTVSFNAQKRHIAFYAGPTTVERFRERLAGIDCGKGCVRYRNADQIDFALLRAMLRDIRARGGPMCGN
ncbi:DUF1801 domain-containing protein [Paracoccus methylovorus]|uniref:DUF1801 domain-containing protein n=2 Tax=Paracoccus methylovorus TaxID=2812658 RepID=A0ABX7JND6_9RHOB|nr:DUF1801 domain-containing protein [Paracoccus methylovorus]